MRQVKQLIIVRNDLRSKLRHGKLAAQVAHASMAVFLQNREVEKPIGFTNYHMALSMTDVQHQWIDGSFTKVVLRADDLVHLVNLSHLAQDNGIPTYIINDAGRTVFKEPTITCMGVGPYYSDTLDELFSDLKMY